MAVILALCGGFALSICQWLIYFYAPVEATLGLAQKIFYLHLPLALWALLSFTLVCIGSIGWLWRRKPKYDNFCEAAAELGLLFGGLALVSGMIWARHSWGVWWTWDPRLTTTLVMWFIYAGYMILRHTEMNPGRRRTVCAVVGIAAFLDVPLVFLSARIFRSIHPAVFGGGGLEPEMRLTVFACIIALGLLWCSLLIIRYNQLELEGRLAALKREFLERG